MANVTVKAQFMLSDGTLVSMSGTLAEGTASELQTSTNLFRRRYFNRSIC